MVKRAVTSMLLDSLDHLMQKKRENVTAAAAFLWRAGYTVHHLESGLTIDEPKLPAARRGHPYCV